MIKKNKIRLVALIEEIKEGNYKIINFVPDIEIKKVIENGSHKQDTEGRYCFFIEKKDIFLIPYAKNIEDLTVIVGGNGSGKTTIINNIFRGYESHLIFEEDNEIIVYCEAGVESILIQQCRRYFDNFIYESFYDLPNIIKFSNTLEWSTGSNLIRPGTVEASDFKDIYMFEKKGWIFQLLEMINQIKFVRVFEDRVSEFVDYTQIGVTLDFMWDGAPNDTNQLVFLDKIDQIPVKEKRSKKAINKRLIDYFSVLINHTIDVDYAKINPQDNEILLKRHLSFLENSSSINLQYHSIGLEIGRFLPDKYSVRGLREDVPDKTLNYENINYWIKIWHIFFIVHLYFVYRRVNKGENDEYRNEIKVLLDKLKSEVEEYKSITSTKIIKELDTYVENIESHYIKNDTTSFNDWEKVWQKMKDPCIRVGKSLSYSSFFKLEEDGSFVKYKLVLDRVWGRLEEIGIPNEDIYRLKEIEDLLYNLNEINTDFKILTSLVNYVLEVSIFELGQSLEIRWIGMSSGELALLKSFANLYSVKLALEERLAVEKNEENYLLLLDEVDLGLHPRWQRKWVSTALPIIEKIFEDKNLQVIITTHSPIFLSDIFLENIVFLDKGIDVSKVKTFEKTFGQNIYTLFKNSFFLDEDELMGEYAYQKIENTIEYLRLKIRGELEIIREESLYYKQSEENAQKISRKIIDSIGEKIIANQLDELFNIAYPDYEKDIDDIEREIKRLQNKLRYLKEGNSQ